MRKCGHRGHRDRAQRISGQPLECWLRPRTQCPDRSSIIASDPRLPPNLTRTAHSADPPAAGGGDLFNKVTKASKRFEFGKIAVIGSFVFVNPWAWHGNRYTVIQPTTTQTHSAFYQMNQSLRWDQDGKRSYRWRGADVYVRTYASVELLQFVTVVPTPLPTSRCLSQSVSPSSIPLSFIS